MTANEEKKLEDLRAERDGAFDAMGAAREAHKNSASEYAKARKQYARALAAYLEYRDKLAGVEQ